MLGWANRAQKCCHTGYATQANHMAPGFQALGHEVTYFAFWGLQGGKVKAEGYTVLPPAFNAWGVDIVKAHKENAGADIVLTHWDIWVVGGAFAEQAYPWVPYFPVDQYPVPELVIERAKQAYAPVVYSQFGLRAMREAGVHCAYVPHGIDCDIFQPRDKMACRKRVGFREDAFIIGMVAANKGYPNRKAIPEALLAFQEFYRRHSEAVLYLHLWPGPEQGIDVRAVIKSLHLPPGSVKFVDEYQYLVGLPDKYLADAYNSFNVLHAASMGEGLGLPILESQACGTRVVTTNCSAMPENTFDGIVTEPAQKFWTQLNSWAVMPSVENMLEAWERIYAGELGDPFEHSQKAVDGAQQFDWPVVLENHWKPFLEELEERLEADKRAALFAVEGGLIGPGPNHVHEWAPTGLYVDGVMCVPCLHNTCPAEMRVLRSGRREVRPTGFEMWRDGIALHIEDDPEGAVAKIVFRELQSSYRLDDIPFEDGDVVLDIGAHVGVVSIYLARRYPAIRVFAFEPVPANYERLVTNIANNGVHNVMPIQAAISGDGRDLALWGNLEQNSGGSSALVPGGGEEYAAQSITLEKAFEQFVPGRCKLLKMDIEGMEYEVLAASNDLLKRVDYLALEIHTNALLASQGETAERLTNICASYIPEERLRVCVSGLADGALGS